jgi:hypothetical protein
MTARSASLAALAAAYLVISLAPAAAGTRYDVDSDDYEVQKNLTLMDVDVHVFHLKVNDEISFEVVRVQGARLTVHLFDMKYFFEATHNQSFEAYKCCSKTDTNNFTASYSADKEKDYGLLVTVTNPNDGNSSYTVHISIRRAGAADPWAIVGLVVIGLVIALVVGLLWFSGTRKLKKKMDQRRKETRDKRKRVRETGRDGVRKG